METGITLRINGKTVVPWWAHLAHGRCRIDVANDVVEAMLVNPDIRLVDDGADKRCDILYAGQWHRLGFGWVFEDWWLGMDCASVDDAKAQIASQVDGRAVAGARIIPSDGTEEVPTFTVLVDMTDG